MPLLKAIRRLNVPNFFSSEKEKVLFVKNPENCSKSRAVKHFIAHFFVSEFFQNFDGDF